MASHFTISLLKKDEKHIPEILKLAKLYNAEVMYFDTKDGKGYQFDFEDDNDRKFFKEETDKLELFEAE